MIPAYWPAATAHLSNDPVLARLIAAYPGEALTARGDAFYTLARSITGQQISVKAAASVWNKLEATTSITPAGIIAAPDHDLRSAGLSWQKIAYLRALVAHFAEHSPAFDAMTDAAVIADLTKIKGIGVWTAEMFLIFHLQRPDVLPLKDIGLQKAICHYYDIDTKDSCILEHCAQPWRPYRTVATWYLWRALDPLPVAY